MTDGRRLARPEPVIRALPAGVAVVFRDYEAPAREAIARRLQSLCRARGLIFLVGGDIGLALKIGADGAHLPSSRLAEGGAQARRRAANFIVTAACHDARQIAQAGAFADLIFLSPVFATASHPGSEQLGAARFKALAALSPRPVLALGGVDTSNAAHLAGANVAGLAAIGAFIA